jgi:hypothetical protein
VSGIGLDATPISERQAWFAGGWLILALFALPAMILLLCPSILIYGSAVMESRYVIEIWPCLIVLAAFGYRATAARFTHTVAPPSTRPPELEPVGSMETVR